MTKYIILLDAIIKLFSKLIPEYLFLVYKETFKNVYWFTIQNLAKLIYYFNVFLKGLFCFANYTIMSSIDYEISFFLSTSHIMTLHVELTFYQKCPFYFQYFLSSVLPNTNMVTQPFGRLALYGTLFYPFTFNLSLFLFRIYFLVI